MRRAFPTYKYYSTFDMGAVLQFSSVTFQSNTYKRLFSKDEKFFKVSLYKLGDELGLQGEIVSFCTRRNENWILYRVYSYTLSLPLVIRSLITHLCKWVYSSTYLEYIIVQFNFSTTNFYTIMKIFRKSYFSTSRNFCLNIAYLHDENNSYLLQF